MTELLAVDAADLTKTYGVHQPEHPPQDEQRQSLLAVQDDLFGR